MLAVLAVHASAAWRRRRTRCATSSSRASLVVNVPVVESIAEAMNKSGGEFPDHVSEFTECGSTAVPGIPGSARPMVLESLVNPGVPAGEDPEFGEHPSVSSPGDRQGSSRRMCATSSGLTRRAAVSQMKAIGRLLESHRRTNEIRFNVEYTLSAGRPGSHMPPSLQHALPAGKQVLPRTLHAAAHRHPQDMQRRYSLPVKPGLQLVLGQPAAGRARPIELPRCRAVSGVHIARAHARAARCQSPPPSCDGLDAGLRQAGEDR